MYREMGLRFSAHFFLSLHSAFSSPEKPQRQFRACLSLPLGREPRDKP